MAYGWRKVYCTVTEVTLTLPPFNYTVTTTTANSQSSNHLVLFRLVTSLTCQSEAVAWSLMMSKSRTGLNSIVMH
jgi:hypothetical protein